jgi:hypothetical protein
MRIKNIITTSIVLLSALSFSACMQDDTTDNVSGLQEKISIAITVNCITGATASDIDTYETIIAGDEIIQDETNTTLNIVVDSTGNQKVCLESGTAHILR